MMRVGIRGIGLAKLRDALQECAPFTTSGALRGDVWNRKFVSQYGLGELNTVERNRFMLDHLTGIAFVVWSYRTPIAWVRNDGIVYHVSQRFSRTTSRHQSLISGLGAKK